MDLPIYGGLCVSRTLSAVLNPHVPARRC
jgi:hypothetical protein